MKIISQGIDLVECSRIAELLEQHGDRFRRRILTEAEQGWAADHKNPIPHIAGRFAAKEAILKALGTGWRGQIAWTDMEILNDSAGCPTVVLIGECAHIAEHRGIDHILISITHTKEHAAATAIAVSNGD